MSTTVQANDGTMLPLESLPVVFGYTGSNITTITVQYQGKTFIQTLSYAGSNVTNISGWEVQ
jgi:hypothetical protein